jgi:hypothetical protein
VTIGTIYCKSIMIKECASSTRSSSVSAPVYNYALDDVVSWNIFFNYFVFKLNDKEDGSGWFYIVQFNDDGQISVSKV